MRCLWSARCTLVPKRSYMNFGSEERELSEVTARPGLPVDFDVQSFKNVIYTITLTPQGICLLKLAEKWQHLFFGTLSWMFHFNSTLHSLKSWNLSHMVASHKSKLCQRVSWRSTHTVLLSNFTSQHSAQVMHLSIKNVGNLAVCEVFHRSGAGRSKHKT